MIKDINKRLLRCFAPRNDTGGQTALILILLTAAALIFLAITLNWGRIAQVKALVTIAADESASLLASDAASYGEMEKQTYLNDTNEITESTGILLAIILVIISIIISIIFPPSGAFMWALTIASIAMAIVNLVLQVVVIQPGITKLWNSLQKNQPIQQQFFEGGIASALQGSVGDQVNITDYLDSNANGQFGLNANNLPNDTVSRFAVFYTDRLKMLNQKPLPAVVFFYNALGELMNGETCDQNANDVSLFGASPNPSCTGLGCAADPINPACQVKIPGGFQLNDACTGSSPTNTSSYSPYCDPCCQPQYVPGSNPPKALRPASCTSGDSNCSINNPYGSSYLDIYDPSFQNYPAGLSFLDQFGRDQQMGPFTTTLTPQGNANNGIYFPNGIYPFFWLMNDYSPEVDNINAANLQSSQVHWCAAGGSIPSSGVAPTGFPDLVQLTLPYTCSGQDCCVNYLGNSANGMIDMVGSTSFGPNPALNSNFGEGGSGSWLPGDNQMCLASWTYNGSSSTGLPDGTCEWTNSANLPSSSTPISGVSTVDGLDDTLHTLSDFVAFADTFLSKDVGTLSSTISSWYPQIDAWIDPTTGRLPPLVSSLNAWNAVMTNWLGQTYTSSGAWCLPSETTLLNGNSSTAEDTYIKANSGTTTWGDLPHVVSCLNYNSSTTVSNYQACQTALTSCPASLPVQCAASVLGRSLAGAAPAYDSCGGQYSAWVQNSLTLATNQAPKFTLRALYLQDALTRAQTMQRIFNQGAVELQNFLSGPAAQLETACQTGRAALLGNDSCPSPSTSALPNSVIYGWVDNLPSGGSGGCMDSSGNRVGCAHIVKVTAYSPGRNVNQSAGRAYVADSVLPWIQTSCTHSFLGLCLSRSYTLVERDEYVYVSVKRWDEDHGSPILFPNGHPLWQFMFHNPGGTASTGQGLPPACNGVTLPDGTPIGFGLMPLTVQGLGFANIHNYTADEKALANAFMLNDTGNGKVDPYALNSTSYSGCLSAVNALLVSAPESHMCAEYIASLNASGASSPGANDYSLKFVNCNSVPGFTNEQSMEDLQ